MLTRGTVVAVYSGLLPGTCCPESQPPLASGRLRGGWPELVPPHARAAKTSAVRRQSVRSALDASPCSRTMTPTVPWTWRRLLEMTVNRRLVVVALATQLVFAVSPSTAYSLPDDRHGNTLADFREVSRAYGTVTIPGEGVSAGYTGPGIIVRYQSKREQDCAIVYEASRPYIDVRPGGDRYAAGDSYIMVGAGCGSGLVWTPRLYIFLAPPGGYYLRASGSSEFTPPGQQDYGYVGEYCNLGSSSQLWRHQVSDGAARQDAYLSCNAS